MGINNCDLFYRDCDAVTYSENGGGQAIDFCGNYSNGRKMTFEPGSQ